MYKEGEFVLLIFIFEGFINFLQWFFLIYKFVVLVVYNVRFDVNVFCCVLIINDMNGDVGKVI